MRHAPRIMDMDILRGIAVVLMLQQHLVAWFWDIPRMTTGELVTNYPVALGLNALGGLAAPIFTVLAGAGAFLFYQQKERADQVIIKRGIFVLLAGYLLNFLCPAWFSMGSWYVLHMIGFAFIGTPLFIRMDARARYLAVAVILVATSIFQGFLNTPPLTTNVRMADLSMPGGMFRLMLIEGHFPIFPWLAFHLVGLNAGQMVFQGKRKHLLISGILLVVTGLFLALMGQLVPSLMHSRYLSRLFHPSPLFYPVMGPLALVLMGGVLIFMEGTGFVADRLTRFPRAMEPLGRVSFTVIMVHIPLFKELLVRTGYYRHFSLAVASIVTVFVILAAVLISHAWKKREYRYGFEWIMRAVT